VIAVALALSGTSFAVPVAAAEPSPAELAAARELFHQALDHEEKEEWERALELFRKVGAVKMTPPVRFHIALCLENLGHLVDAYDEFMRARGEAEGDPKPDAAMLRSQSDKHLADLKARIPRVVLVVQVPIENETIAVAIDGKPVNAALFGTPIPLDPGTHKISAKSSRATFEEKITVAEHGGTRTVTVTLDESAAPTSAGPDRAPEKTWRSPPLVSWIAASAGVVLIGTSVALFSMSRSTFADVRDECAGRSPCPADLRDRYEDGRVYNTWGNVLLISGAVAVGAGVVLWVAAPRGETKTASSAPTLAMGLGPLGVNVAGAF
jgi:hypothetical protein